MLRLMHAVLAFAVTFLGNAPVTFPEGSYRVDLTNATVADQLELGEYFLDSFLIISSESNRFSITGQERRGFWRGDRDRFAMVFDEVREIPSTLTTASLMRIRPATLEQGFYLRRGPNKSLLLDWKNSVGRVFFTPMPERTVSELVNLHEEAPSHAIRDEAHLALSEIRNGSWKGLLAVILDPNESKGARTWAAIMYTSVRNPEGIREGAKALVNVSDWITRTFLVQPVANYPSDETVDLLLHAQSRGLLRPENVAPALGKLMRKKDVPLLMEWLGSDRGADQEAALIALTAMRESQAIVPARRLVSAKGGIVQARAWGLIATLSSDTFERNEAFANLARLAQNPEGMIGHAALDALIDTRSSKALPYMTAILNSNIDGSIRRDAASALADLGDPRAIPALVQATKRKDDPETEYWKRTVIRAAAEAIESLQQVERAL